MAQLSRERAKSYRNGCAVHAAARARVDWVPAEKTATCTTKVPRCRVRMHHRSTCTCLVREVQLSLSLVQSRALLGLDAAAVTVEVHLANGLPSFTLVGLADVEVKEARERVRSAIQNSGLEFPANKRITVNLAPADLPKD